MKVAKSRAIVLNSEVCKIMQPEENTKMPLAEPDKWRHHILSLSPEQRKAITRNAAKESISQRQYVQNILTMWLRKPTRLQPIISIPNRVRFAVNIDIKVHAKLSAHAKLSGVTMSAVSYTAIAHHLSL
jgi:predicted HicB family RNase H-like nuclease